MPDIRELAAKSKEFELKLKAGGFYIPVKAVVEGQKMRLQFGYNRALLDVVKSQFEKRRWLGVDGGPKEWEIPLTRRNIFRLNYLQGKYAEVPTYERFDRVDTLDATEAIKAYVDRRNIKLMQHQYQMINQALQTQRFIWGAEMGLGKSLAALIVMEMMMERFGIKDAMWVGTVGANVSVQAEFAKWRTPIRSQLLTYEGMRSWAEKYKRGEHVPQMIIFDEGSKLKNITAKRTQAATFISDLIHETYGYESIIGLMTGTPAPKSPVDWWALSEVVWPGFLSEGHPKVLQERLAVVEMRETVPGAGTYPQLIGWLDDDKKCRMCCQVLEHANHGVHNGSTLTTDVHVFQKTENEVAKLHKRLKGLVGIWLKEKCTDLPPLRYEVIKVKPNRATLNAAKIVAKTATRAVEALTLLRELSDGFQYKDLPTGKKVDCGRCCGNGQITEYLDPKDPNAIYSAEEVAAGARFVYGEPNDLGESEIVERIPVKLEATRVTCDACDGSGKIDEIKRTTVFTDCPKDDILIRLLSEHEEIGRLNVYGGFTGSVDRIESVAHKQQWATLRVDGRGWCMKQPNGQQVIGTNLELLNIYCNPSDEYPQMVFIGQADAAGMGLTLTVSPTTFFYSNVFNAESRQQAEARGHRLGMDVVKGGRIVDCVHLDTDMLVLENLKRKRDLQHMTMTGVARRIEEEINRDS